MEHLQAAKQAKQRIETSKDIGTIQCDSESWINLEKQFLLTNNQVLCMFYMFFAGSAFPHTVAESDHPPPVQTLWRGPHRSHAVPPQCVRWLARWEKVMAVSEAVALIHVAVSPFPVRC